jgi:flagellar biosynthesis/type III secretory pathway protein FliH
VAAELETRPELVLEVVSGALRRATERDRLVVEVSPQDFPLVRDAADDLAGRLGGIQRLEVVAERRVERGGCIVRTPEGEIDGRISEQMERLAEVFDAARRKPTADA